MLSNALRMCGSQGPCGIGLSGSGLPVVPVISWLTSETSLSLEMFEDSSHVPAAFIVVLLSCVNRLLNDCGLTTVARAFAPAGVTPGNRDLLRRPDANFLTIPHDGTTPARRSSG